MNLSEITQSLAYKNALIYDTLLVEYVRSSIKMLESQGKDITKFALVNVSNPMELEGNSVAVKSQWRIVPVDLLTPLPSFEDEE